VSACGIDGVRSPAELPEPVDLAVIAVPAPAVVDVARSCGDRGVRALAVLSAGFAEAGPDGAARQDELLAVVREHGMRLLGPNCIGLVNNDPAVRLDATFADLPHRGGSFAVLTQSGAFGVGVLEAADELGLGVSRFVSIGDKADVGGNDLLLAWGDDPDVEVIGMYLESVGDPLRFARIARSVTRRKPIIAVKSGTTEAGRRAGRSHTAAAASPDVAVDALFHAAGVTRVATTAELLDLARVLTTQPALRGPRVAIVGNSGGPQILAADAAERAGLDVVGFGPTIEERLRRLGVAPTNPLDLGAGATADTMAAVLGAITTSDRVDAVITVFTRLATTDADRVRTEVCAAADRCAVPILAVEIGAPAGVVRGASGTRHVPIFSFAEPAAAALGLAYRCTRSRSAADAAPIPPAGVDRSAARVLVDTAMATGGEWLDAASTADLLRAYRIPVSRFALATSGDEAVARAEALGYPVAVKLADPRVHKSDVGGVRLDLRNGEEVRTAAGVLLRLCPPEHRQLLVQPMTREGTELIVGAVHDRTFGPLVMLGAGGVLTDIAQDRAFRIAPLSELDAESLVRELRTSRLLDGYRGAPVVPRSLVLDLVVRVAAMVSDLPEIAELDLNPVICRADGLVVVDARVRVAAPPRHPDPLVRQLRSSPTA
jgi:acyl-CoA synthetase (NDP forming)